MNGPAVRLSRYESIDAHRGVACLAVVLFHSLGAFAQVTLWAPLQPVRRVAMHPRFAPNED